jgi:hypothetical protein
VRLDTEDAEGAEQDDDRDRSYKSRQPRIAQGIVDLGPDHRRLRKVVIPDIPPLIISSPQASSAGGTSRPIANTVHSRKEKKIGRLKSAMPADDIHAVHSPRTMISAHPADSCLTNYIISRPGERSEVR